MVGNLFIDFIILIMENWKKYIYLEDFLLEFKKSNNNTNKIIVIS